MEAGPRQLSPFRPVPGSVPAALVGRDSERAAVQYGFELTRSGAAAQPIVFTGLRGMGKTALLRQCVADAEANGGVVVYCEASNDVPLEHSLQRGLTRAQRDNASLSQRVRQAIGDVARAFPSATYELPNDLGGVELAAPRKPRESLAAALEHLNGAVRKHGRYLVIAIDEIQEAPVSGLRDVVIFIHESSGPGAAPACFLGAGLPSSRGHLHEVRTYTERWRYFQLGLLNAEQTRLALDEPARERGVTIETRALDRLVLESAGYPFFVQEYGAAAWTRHRGRKITDSDVAAVVPGVRKLLESDFYQDRVRSLTGRELRYVIALAELGTGPHASGDVAKHMNSASPDVSSIRRRLVEKDVIYAPASGMIEFRIPLMDRYVLAHREQLLRRVGVST